MAKILRTATSTWNGDLKNGGGTATTTSGALKDTKITFGARFEGDSGANPEELLAAAEASCFSMALSANLGQAGFSKISIKTKVSITMIVDGGFKITEMHIDTEAKVDGITSSKFEEIAENTKNTCPVSVLLKSGLEKSTMSAKLN